MTNPPSTVAPIASTVAAMAATRKIVSASAGPLRSRTELTVLARRVLSMDLPGNVLVNVNFPDVAAGAVKGIKVTRQGVRAFGGHIVERTDPRGGTYYWIAYAPGHHEHDEESDITAVRSGWISVTPLHLDLTHEATRRRLAQHFETA